MNCGFEDAVILDELLAKYDNDFAKTLPEFTTCRVQNCQTIVDLAMYNYVEMRDLVNSPTFLLRKKFDSVLHKLFPNSWIPLYSMVTFSRIPYAECLRRRQWQDKMLAASGKLALLSTLAATASFAFYRSVRSGVIAINSSIIKLS